ncbi:DNA polymerase III subunit delta [Croceivirga thetidis]|uniref:DNA polymerase III subunit delta n=1 Tax=Croceivirga thetidis TaxID=2721623 RepID=A0ABX1GR49_9FLAO|nr:DNA polymerase III subunit delta [Croceivirga thetidis]NKI32428.1 DNA polymerase III subunit delta [Croceivirga thetidis]
MEEVKKILKDIKSKELKPIYFLMGDEPYYIDLISDYISNSVLTEEERGFNQMVLYGKDTTIDEITSNAKRFPMMADYQVIIVKEAQQLSRTIEQLGAYAKNPQLTTILVVCYKYKKLDKRKKLHQLIKENGIVLETKKLYDNQVGPWISSFAKARGLEIDFKGSEMMAEFLGNDLSRISNEFKKMLPMLTAEKKITPEFIEKHIGISKDYNNFELKKAIGEKNIKKVGRIVSYFSQNPKDNPFVVTVATLQAFFVQLLQYHGLKDKSSRNVASALRINPFFVNEFEVAAKNYPMKQVSRIISHLRNLDLKGKGVGSQNISQADLLKELLAGTF